MNEKWLLQTEKLQGAYTERKRAKLMSGKSDAQKRVRKRIEALSCSLSFS